MEEICMSIFKSTNKFKLLSISVLISLLIVSFVLATTVTNVSLNGETITQTKYINTSQNYTFNFTVNTTNQNVSQILVNTTVINISNIFIPNSSNTNWSSSFNNATNLLNWTNITNPLNGTAWFSFNFSVSDSLAGAFNITIYANNTTIVLINTTQFVADAYNPIASINSVNGLTSGNYTNNNTLSINFTANDTNIYSWNLSLFNSTNLIKNWTGNNNTVSNITNYTVSSDGTYYINLTVNDMAGKVNFSTFNITVDTTPPTAYINISNNDTYTNTSLVTLYLNYTDATSGCDKCRYSNNGENWTDWENCTTTKSNWNLTNPTYGGNSSEGIKIVWYEVRDKANNTNTTFDTIILDTTKPSITINSPDSDSVLNSTMIAINLTSTDANLNYTNISIINSTGSLVNSTINWTNGTYVVLLSVPIEGVYNITATTYDKAGNSNTTTITNITIDTTPPTIIITSPTNITPTYKQPGMNITISYTYTELNPKNLAFYLLNQSGVPVANKTLNESVLYGGINVSNTTCITIPNNVPAGFYHINATMYDLANNGNFTIQPNSTYITNQTFDFYGVTYDQNATEMNGTNVTIEVYQMAPNQPPSLVDSFTDISDENGTFNVTNITYYHTLFYKPIVRHFNGTLVDYIGPSLPMLPAMEFHNLGSVKFYLKEGATLNITAVNATGGPKTFNYMIKDTKLGYPIAEHFVSNPDLAVNQTIVYVPADRNYSIMIYPFDSFPMSFDLNNLSNYTAPKKVDIQFNCSQEWKWVSGYAKYNENANFTNLTIITYLFEPGNMISKDHPLPLNMGLWKGPPTNDTINATTGFFNITLPATTSGMKLLLFANAEKNGTYYGNFRNITLTIGGNNTTNFNFTLHKLIGSNSTLSVEKAGQEKETVNISTKESSFKLTNGTIPVKNAHIEVRLDYTDINGSEFTFMADVSPDSNGTFKLPLLNHSIDRINIFSPDFAPKKLSLEASDLATQPVTITLKTFRPGKPGGAEIKDISIEMFKHNKEGKCDVPHPDKNCSLMPQGNITQFNTTTFNPLSVMMSGAKMSLRMKKVSNNITVHYVNVDLFASGPPDAVFDSNSSDTKGDTFAQAWRFGSEGPEIYDYVIIGIPYKEANQSQTGFNESADINLSIPYLYDDNWNVIWNQSAGDNTTDINSSDTLKDFRDYLNSEYEAYLNGTKVTCNESDVNLTGLCYKDTTNNMLWFRIPHFSGIGPENEGDILKANLESCNSSSECVGGYCVHGYCWNAATRCGDGYCDSGETHANCPSDCPSTSTGGGGTYTPLPKQIHSWTKITPGVATIMKITKKEIGLKQIQIEVKNPANNVRITVTKLEGKPASVTQEISGKVYKYLEINAENLNETNLERAKIQFEVNKTWVLENNLDKNRIYLYRFVNNEWQKLTTRLLNETDNYINYEAETPGFSYFAIGGEEKVCEEGKKRCSNNNLEQCINNSWKLIETCNYGCNETTLTCNPKPTEKICEEGTRRCLNNNLQECENGEWKTIETCEYGCNSTSLTCNPAPVTAEKPEEIKKKDYTWIYIAITAIIILAGLGYYFLVYKKK